MTTETLDKTELENIIHTATNAAYRAADTYFHDELGGVDQYACGFAWVELISYKGQKITGRSRLGRMLKELGVRQDHARVFYIWNPASYPVQNVDTLEAGARAAAEVFKRAGFEAVSVYRLD